MYLVYSTLYIADVINNVIPWYQDKLTLKSVYSLIHLAMSKLAHDIRSYLLSELLKNYFFFKNISSWNIEKKNRLIHINKIKKSFSGLIDVSKFTKWCIVFHYSKNLSKRDQISTWDIHLMFSCQSVKSEKYVSLVNRKSHCHTRTVIAIPTSR